MKNFELLAPAGNLDKLKTALYYGADAVYLGGKNLSLRSFSDNFDNDQLKLSIDLAHAQNKKVYVTVNIFARNADFCVIETFLKYLESINADGVIVSDPGVIMLSRKVAPNLPVHISTQANTLNKYSASFWADCGAKRIILARELSLDDIKEIRDYLPSYVEIEAFCHGAMCISYSGRCLLSDYFANRSSNRGQCVQACRWNYSLREKNSEGEYYDITEDEKGTYILNSKDLNMISYLDKMFDAGVSSLKIEGRMKSEYYVATVINAYRRAIDEYERLGASYKNNPLFESEILKTNHRAFTTAYMMGDNHETVNYADSQSVGEKTFIAVVLGYDAEKGVCEVQMRNRFFVGDKLEVLSPSDSFNKVIEVTDLRDESGNVVTDAKIVQQKLYLKTDIPLCKGDILRK